MMRAEVLLTVRRRSAVAQRSLRRLPALVEALDDAQAQGYVAAALEALERLDYHLAPVRYKDSPTRAREERR